MSGIPVRTSDGSVIGQIRNTGMGWYADVYHRGAEHTIPTQAMTEHAARIVAVAFWNELEASWRFQQRNHHAT